MLYDPKWQQQPTKADPFSLDSLIAWLEKQPTAESYCYLDNGGCLLAQYFAAHRFHNPSVGVITVHHGEMLLEEFDLPPGFDDISVQKPRTFGAALERARALRQGTQE